MPTLAHLRPLVAAKSHAVPLSCDAIALRFRLGYDVTLMRSSGYDPSIIEEHQVFNDTLDGFVAHPLIGEYLTSLTPQKAYAASGVRVLPLGDMKDEIQQLAPGALIFAHGYLPFARSIGGHALCFQLATGGVVWADHDIFGHNDITYQDRSTGHYRTVPFTPEHIQQAVVSLGYQIQTFLADLLHDRLEERLNELD